MEASSTRNPKLRTACDRCYQLKERCERTTSSAHCIRCERLGLDCLIIRPVRPVGRRTRHGKDVVSGMAKRRNREEEPGIEACLDALPGLQAEEKDLLLFFQSQQNILDQFVICSSFPAEPERSLATPRPDTLPLLKDAYIACAMTLKQLHSGFITDIDTTICVSYISKAISTLRSLPVFSSQDMVVCHTLGSILAFSIYIAIGVGAPEISRYCLNATGPLIGTRKSNKYEDPWQTFLVLLDTADCLVHRRKPAQMICIPTATVDPRLGLCLPLLPYYHDLCVISNSLLDATDVGILARLQNQLDYIHHAVESWQPSHSDQFVEQFDSADIVNLLAQAKVYRLGALLVSHRLKFPFGCEDIQAEIWSKEALLELQIAKSVTRRTLQFVTLPFIVAAVEVKNESLRFKTLQSVDEYVDNFAPFMQKATKIFLSRVWHERDQNLTHRWFDSIHKPCPVMDCIDATCFGNP